VQHRLLAGHRCCATWPSRSVFCCSSRPSLSPKPLSAAVVQTWLVVSKITYKETRLACKLRATNHRLPASCSCSCQHWHQRVPVCSLVAQQWRDGQDCLA
jgi:hypothetical protein